MRERRQSLAGAIGLALSIWGVRWLRAQMPPLLPAAVMPELDPEVVVATMAVSMLAGIFFGMAPALQAVAGMAIMSSLPRSDIGDPTARYTIDGRPPLAMSEPPIADLQPLRAYIDASLSGLRAIGVFLGALGAIALVLAAMGVYGVMAHSVVQQRRDIGIRMALGACRGEVIAALARSGLTLLGVGLALGLPIAFPMFRGTLASLSLLNADVGLGYALVLAGVLVVVAVLATLLPAGRASSVAPVVALKE